jgi:hypothetical protein
VLKANLSGAGGQEEFWPWGSAQVIERVNSANKVQGSSLLEFGRILLDSVPALDFVPPGLEFFRIPLGLRSEKFAFRYGGFGFPPSRRSRPFQFSLSGDSRVRLRWRDATNKVVDQP